MALRNPTIRKRDINLKDTLVEVGELLRMPLTVYLFGSRREQTGSLRSDIDLLLITDRRITNDDAQGIWEKEPYLDIFGVTAGVAESLVNESRIQDRDNAALIKRLNAVPLFLDGTWQESANQFCTITVLAERNPAASVIPMYDLTDVLPDRRSDLLVMTALPEEHEAVVHALGAGGAVEPVVRLSVTDNENEPWDVTVSNINEMGSVAAALRTREEALNTKAPHIVLAGICAGIPGKVQLCDVVIPKSILYFETGKIVGARREPGDDQRQCDEDVLMKAAIYATDLSKMGLTIHAGDLIACGEKVVASQEFRRSIQKKHRKIIAIDMESYGVARAAESAGRSVTVIKGVCDFADEKKHDDYRQEAVTAAASTLRELIVRRAFATP